MPKIPNTVRVRGLNAIRVSVRLDMKKGEVLEANIVSGGHPLVDPVVLKAARGAKFEPDLNESMPGRNTGFITFILGNLNRHKNARSSPFLIFPKGVMNSAAKTIPKPAAVRAGKKFAAGKVEVAVLIDVYVGTVMASKSISGPPELPAVSEKTALGAKFSTLTASGSNIKFAAGLIVFTFYEDGRVEYFI